MLNLNQNILVLAAITGELEAFIEPLQTKTDKLGLFTYYIDELKNGNKVYCVLCGAGKVNSAAVASAFISQKELNIGFVLNTGTAGSLSKQACKGDVVVGVDYCQHDYDITGLFSDFEVGQMMGKDNVFDVVPADIIEMLPKDDGVHFGTILSGDRFVDGGIAIEHCEPLAVDMESAAVAHICYDLYKVPFLAVRAITDGADENAHEDWKTLHARLSVRAAEYSKEVIKVLYKTDFK